MPLLASAALALVLQDRNGPDSASLNAQPPAQQQSQEAPAPQATAVQDAPAAEATTADDLAEIDRELADFGTSLHAGWNVDVHGYIKLGTQVSDDERAITSANDLVGFTLTAMRLWVDAEVEDWKLRFGFRSENHSGLSFFGLPGKPGNLRLFELVATREINDYLRLQVGRLRSPFIASGLYDDNSLLFFERSFIGEDWDNFTNGAVLNARYGDLEAWLGVQNGVDNFGSSLGLTARGMWHIVGGGGAMRLREGPYGAPDELSVSIGGAAYYDTETDNSSSQAIEGYLCNGPMYLSAEVVDKGPGLGDLYSWSATAAAMVLDDLSLAGRIENFDRDDGTDLYRVGLTHYVVGNDVKLHLEYSGAESNAPLANIKAVTFGAQFSF